MKTTFITGTSSGLGRGARRVSQSPSLARLRLQPAALDALLGNVAALDLVVLNAGVLGANRSVTGTPLAERVVAGGRLLLGIDESLPESIPMPVRERSWLWSRAFYEAQPQIHGLFYASCMHENSPSLALSQRSAGAIPVQPPFHCALADQALRLTLRNAVGKLNYLLL